MHLPYIKFTLAKSVSFPLILNCIINTSDIMNYICYESELFIPGTLL